MSAFKTLHFTNAWHSRSGGIGTFYRALLDRAEKRGHLMRLVVPSDVDRIEELGEFTRIHHVRAAQPPWNREYRMMYPNLYLPPHSRLPCLIAEESPDLIEINDKYTLNYLGGLLRERWVKGINWRPTVVGLSCERMDENMAAYVSTSHAAAWFCRAYMKWLYFPMCDHHITVSPHTAAELAVAARGHKVQRGVWIGPMGVDYKLFSSARVDETERARLRAISGARRGAKFLLYAGRLAKEKNLGLLIDMMECLRASGVDCHLLLAGIGEQRAPLETAAERRAPGSVHFLGHVGSREELARLYANVDLFVHSNPNEPFGIAPLEAMAAGLPLLAPNSGGVMVYANESNAWLAPPEGKAFAASALNSLERDPALRARRVRAARQTAERFGWDVAADHYLDLYAELHTAARNPAYEPTIRPDFYSSFGNYWGRESDADRSCFGLQFRRPPANPSLRTPRSQT